jgi:molybdopterin molybdotransferase
MGLMSVEDARAAMVGAVRAGPGEMVALARCAGRVLDADVIARVSQPPFDASAMDGWAVRAADGLAPRTIVGESAAGRPFAGTVGPGQAVRIFTGAALPDGADHVVMQEDATRDGMVLRVADLGKPDIRRAGLDFAAGATLLRAGQALTGARPALLAAAGLAEARVRRKPRVALVPTGDELLPPGDDPRPGAIFESVGHGLSALVAAWGGEPILEPVAPDRPGAVAHALKAARSGADLIVLIGGASVGDHDHAREAASGGEVLVEKVAVRPGKPTWFALTPEGPILGLPGNPASALVCARLFLAPLIEGFLGLATEERAAPFAVRLGHDLPANGARAHVRRAIVAPDATGALVATSRFDDDSSLLTPFATANALLVAPPDAPPLATGAVASALWMAPRWT